MRECRYDGLTGDIVEDGDIKTTTCEKPCSDDEKVGNVGNISAWKDEVIIARCQKCTGQSEANCKEWLYPTCQIEVGEHDDGNFIDGEEDTDANVSGWKKDGWGNTDGDAIMKDQISSYRTRGPEDCRFKAYERLLNHPDGSGESVMLETNTVGSYGKGEDSWRVVPPGWNDIISAVQITGGGRRDFSPDAAWRRRFSASYDSDSD